MYLLWVLIPLGLIHGLNPIIIRGNKMYDSVTGDRFFMKGITYGYVVDDANYDKTGKTVFDTNLASLHGHFNTVRLYNINPDLSYSKFMNHMNEIGVYVLISAAPANDPYYGGYRYSTMRKDLNPSGTIQDGGTSIDQTESCYPAKLLEFGKKILKKFARYDNTLGVIAANEIMQTTLTAAACVKQYVSDMKNWMRVNGSKMRLLPIAFAIADSAYKGGDPDSDTYGAIKLQGLLCGDTMRDGLMYQSIDILLVNEYRWCPGSTFAEAYSRLVSWASGAPIVLGLGEFGCKNAGDSARTFDMVPYMLGTVAGNQNMHEIFSGGTAYSYGRAFQGADSLFPLFLGGSEQITGTPSDEKTVDFDNLVSVFKDNDGIVDKAGWSSDNKCRWTPEVKTSIAASNTQVASLGWIVSDCKKIFVTEGDTWKTTSRNGAVCSDSGGPCDVSVVDQIGKTEVDICGFVDIVSGGASCDSNAECGLHGVCSSGKCSCIGCYSGPQCDVKNTAQCAELSSISGIWAIIGGVVGALIVGVILVFLVLHRRAQKHVTEVQKIGNQAKLASEISDDTAVSVM